MYRLTRGLPPRRDAFVGKVINTLLHGCFSSLLIQPNGSYPFEPLRFSDDLSSDNLVSSLLTSSLSLSLSSSPLLFSLLFSSLLFSSLVAKVIHTATGFDRVAVPSVPEFEFDFNLPEPGGM